MLVKIKPRDLEKWHGKKGLDSFAQTVSVKALYDTDTGTYATGLSNKEEEELEKVTGLDLSNTFNPLKPHPFWDTKPGTLVLPNHTIILNTDLPFDNIKIHIAKASKFVANSLEDLEKGLFPDATHVIFDEEQEVELKARKIELRKSALKKVLKMSKNEKLDLILIISGKLLKKQSDSYIEVEMDKIVQDKPSMLLEYANRDKAYIKNRAFILEAIQSNVLQKRNGSIYYMDEVIGGSIDDTINYLNDPKNQNLKVIILDKLV